MSEFPITIRQLKAPYRVVRLERSALPEGQFLQKMGLVFSRVLYPGATEPTYQILNVEHKPITLSGLLSDRESGVYGFAEAGRLALMAIWREAKPISIVYRGILLNGLLSHVTFGEITSSEIRYEMEIEIINLPVAGPAVTPYYFTFEYLNGIATQLADVEVAYEDLPSEILDAPFDIGSNSKMPSCQVRVSLSRKGAQLLLEIPAARLKCRLRLLVFRLTFCLHGAFPLE